MKDRIKTYSFWVSLSASLVVLIQAIGRVFGFIANADLVNNIVMGIAGVLVVFGIVSSPTEEELRSKNKELEKDLIENQKSEKDSGKPER